MKYFTIGLIFTSCTQLLVGALNHVKLTKNAINYDYFIKMNRAIYMKNMIQLFISFLIVFSLVSCTSFTPVNMTTNELQKQISAGKVINSHNKVKLQTYNGKSHELIVTRVTSTHVQSKNKSIPINTIISMKKSGVNHAKTAGLTVIVLVAVALAVAYKVVGDVTDDVLE